MNQSTDLATNLLAGLDEATLLAQLGCPEDALGLAVGDMLARSNQAVIEASFELLDLHAREKVLEIGLGNGEHIADVLEQASGLSYTGIDLSPTMITEARRRNTHWLDNGQVWLGIANVNVLPFPPSVFDKAIAINTTYFWPDLRAGLKETRRVLRSGGLLVIAAITPEAAIEMPFAEHGFAVHSAVELETACVDTGFHQIGITRFVEPPVESPQENAPREFYLLRACAR